MLGFELAFGGLLEGVPYGLAGLGFAIIFLTARELHFAYGTTIAIGGYATYSITAAGLPLPVAGLLAVAFCTMLGVIIRFGAYRRLKGHYAVLLFSFGLTVILENVLAIGYGVSDVVVSSPTLSRVIQIVPNTNISARLVQLLGLGILIVAWLVVRWMLVHTKLGLGMTAVIRDPEMAELVGVKAERMKVLAYAMGSGLAGIAGGLTVVSSGVRPSLGFELLIYGFIATLLAGARFTDAALWGLALGVALNISALGFPSEYRTLIVFVALVAYLMVRMRYMPRFAT